MLPRESASRQSLVTSFDRGEGSGLPLLGLPLIIGELLPRQFFARHGPYNFATRLADRTLHLADRLLEHLLGILEVLDEVIEVGGNDVTDASENSHGAAP